MSKKRELAKNTAIIGLGRLFSQFVGFALLPVYTFFLSPAEYGLYDLVLSYVLLLGPVLSIQMEMAVFRYLIDARGNTQQIQKVITSSLAIVAIAVITVLVAGILVWALTKEFLYPVVALYLGLFILTNYLLQVARGLGKNKLYAIASILQALVLVGTVVWLLVFGGGGVVSTVTTVILSMIVAIVYLSISLKVWQLVAIPMLQMQTIREMVGYSWALVPNGAAVWGISMASRVIIVVMLGVAMNGLFAVAGKVAAVLTALFGIVYLSWTEAISLHIKTDHQDHFIVKSLGEIIVITTSFAVVLLIFTALLFDTLIGHEYMAAYVYIPPLILSALLAGVMSLYGSLYIATRRTRSLMYTTVLAALVSIGLSIICLPFLGLYGVAGAMIVAYLVIIGYRHIDMSRYGIYLRYAYAGRLLLAISLFLLACAFYYIDTVWVRLGLAIVISIGLYFLGKKAAGGIMMKIRQSIKI